MNFCFRDETLTNFDHNYIHLLIFQNFVDDTKAKKCNVTMCLYIFFADENKHGTINKSYAFKYTIECHYNYNVSIQKKLLVKNVDLSKPQWACHVI